MTNSRINVLPWDEHQTRVASGFVLERGGELVAGPEGDCCGARRPAGVPLGLESGVEYACQLLAGQVQDDVIAESGRPWPEVRSPGGGYLGVLVPGLVGGVAVWRLGDAAFCPVGLLNGAVRAAGVQITS